MRFLLFLGVYVRKKKNKSGVISVQVIDKSSGKYKLLKTIGSSSSMSVVEQLFTEGKEWIKKRKGQIEIDFTDYSHHTNLVLQGIEEVSVQGPELLLGSLFDSIGFNQIEDEIFRQLVLARLCYPVSKLKTTDYLSKYQFLNIDVQVIYRYLDKLYKSQKEFIQKISYEHTLKILGGSVSIVFYDVTTLHFEAENEDGLRRTGFSKAGKHQNPQIVLGLLVSKGGYPLAYEIFEGNKFEGHTMLPIIDVFKEKYAIKDLIVVADAGLLSKENIALLEKGKYQYILGARIKSVNTRLKNKILALKLKNGENKAVSMDANTKLIISYSDKRAKKDAHNRERGVKKLEKQIKSGKLTKIASTIEGTTNF